MKDFYEELSLDRNKNIDELNADLSRLESIWKRREINNPEKATAMLALIIEARRVFATDAFRSNYDRELANSNKEPVTPDPNAERNKQFEKWYSDALSYFDSGQYDLAKTATDQALSYYDTFTDNDAFYSFVADVYKMNRIYPIALDYINKAIVIKPQNAMHYILKAAIYHHQAYSTQGYDNYAEVEKLIQNARDVLNRAVNIAHQNNDRTSESAGYGLLAFYHYFVPSPDRVKAEEYAKKSVDLGDIWGDASKVLDDIRKKRQQEAEAAEELKRRQEQQAKEEQERKERQAKEEQERKRKEQERKEWQAKEKQKSKLKENRNKALRTLYKICMIVFLGWTVFIFYSIFNLKDDVCRFNVEAVTKVFLIIIAAWNFLGEVSGDDSLLVLKFVQPFIFGLCLLLVGGIKYKQWGERWGYLSADNVVWKFIGINILISIAVIVVFSLIGKAVRKIMKWQRI